ncbi:MAG: ankyrin repeat domain-containing protein [Pseudomonadota bacterium]|nr:ankyrin repeat domain-containing protein [Gammaproteobacteria bacterium]MDA8421418.1 ankyrin repeat domain-containing protein [Pseudomonadota bacterium]
MLQLKKYSSWAQDITIIGLVTLMSVGANLPDRITHTIGLNKDYLLIGLIGIIGVSLVRYLKFALILVIAILAIGANLPGDIAQRLGVDPHIMLFALVAMVVTSFTNFILKLPKGVKPMAQINSSHGARALCNAAQKGHASMVYSLVSAGINPNFRDEKGDLPLVLAAGRGHALVVKLLLDNGAVVDAADAAGNTALTAATRGGFTQTAILIRNAEMRQKAAA